MRRLGFLAALVLFSFTFLIAKPTGAVPPSPDLPEEGVSEQAEVATPVARRSTLLIATTTNCYYCVRLKNETLGSQQVKDEIEESFEISMLDAASNREMVRDYGIRIYPTTIVLSPDGEVLDKIDGFVGPQEFQRRIHRAVTR